jgi:hypothetical protein
MHEGGPSTGPSAAHRPTPLRLLPAAALICSLLTTAAPALTVGEVLATPQRFDRAHVTLTGKAERIRTRTSHRGNVYETFTLVDSTGRVSVFMWNTAQLTAGERVEVRGEFEHVKHVGRYTFHDEVDATSVQPLP